MPDTELGDFLRACRGRMSAQRSGLPATGPRRVAGLRREEVAVIAGVSSDYYARLEQGRERSPSPQMLEALGRAFDLGADAREHLFQLAGIAAPLLRRSPRSDVSPELLQMMDAWTATPATIIDLRLDILARNRLAVALHRSFRWHDNIARMTFLDPMGRSFYVDWERAAQAAVGGLRIAYGQDPSDARLAELVDELTTSSAEFARLWKQHDPRGKSHEAKQFHHPSIGPLTLSYQAFDVRSAPGQQLIVYQAEPGSSSATTLQLLGSLGATPEPETPNHWRH